MPKIPRVMSTQHPDNVRLPFFAESTDMSGEDEIKEVYYAFSHLGCDEQMWDCEGKEADALHEWFKDVPPVKEILKDIKEILPL